MPASLRDTRIDFWRGLCLIDMVLVHLYYQHAQLGDTLGPILGEYTRFAAGGFVFVAGLAMGAIFAPKSQAPGQRWPTYRRLWKRSLRLLAWQYCVAVAWIAMNLLRGIHPPFASAKQFLSSIFLLRDGGDLLPLYMILIAFSPLFLELANRSRGRIVLCAASISAFVYARYHPTTLVFDPLGAFAPLLWQIIFLAGLLAGTQLKRYDKLGYKPKLAIAAGGWIVWALLFWCEYGYAVGLPTCPIHLVFRKSPLTSAEVLRYLSLMTGILATTDLAWSWLGPTRAASFAATLGRSALPVFVAHLFLMEIAGALVKATWAIGLWQRIFVPISLLLLWLLALGLQWLADPARRRAAIEGYARADSQRHRGLATGSA